MVGTMLYRARGKGNWLTGFLSSRRVQPWKTEAGQAGVLLGPLATWRAQPLTGAPQGRPDAHLRQTLNLHAWEILKSSLGWGLVLEERLPPHLLQVVMGLASIYPFPAGLLVPSSPQDPRTLAGGWNLLCM